MAYLGKPREELDRKIIERGKSALKRLEDGLEDTPFLVGERLTADAKAAAIVQERFNATTTGKVEDTHGWLTPVG